MRYSVHVIMVRQENGKPKMDQTVFLITIQEGMPVPETADHWAQYIRAAVNIFLKTKEGHHALQETAGRFDWSDFGKYFSFEFFGNLGIARLNSEDAYERNGFNVDDAAVVVVNQDDNLREET